MALNIPDGIDPELADAARLQPDLDFTDAVATRRSLARAARLSRALRSEPDTGDPVVEDCDVPAREGAPPVRTRTYTPRERQGAALVFFHGGAFVAGDLETEDARCREIARRTGITVYSVDYRLAPEHPFPCGFEDCFDVLTWVTDHSEELGIDRDRVAVGGSSAGGALAAAVSLAARDRGGPALAFQMLLYPVTDDTLASESMNRFENTPGWSRRNSVPMWGHYLGRRTDAPPSPYAAPARAVNLSGLPPAYVMTAEFDPLRDEGLAYATRLMAADVPVEVHNLPGTFHGFDAAAPQSVPGRRALDEQCAVLEHALSRSPVAR